MNPEQNNQDAPPAAAQTEAAFLDKQTTAALDEFKRLLQREHVLNVGAFEDAKSFAHAQRVAIMLSSSSMVPDRYRGEANVGNATIAVDISFRLGLPTLMVMQNLFIVYGTPSWSGLMCIALVNSSGFGPLVFEFKGEKGKDEWGCRAVGNHPKTGAPVHGPWVDIALAKAEGWWDRKDKDGKKATKWPTLTELMLRYRAGAYFGRTICPEKLLGLRTVEEVEESPPEDTTPTPKPSFNAAPVKDSLTTQPSPKHETKPTEPETKPKEKPKAKEPEPAAKLDAKAEPADGQPTPQEQVAKKMTEATVSFPKLQRWLVRSGRFNDATGKARPEVTSFQELPTDVCEKLLADARGIRLCIMLCAEGEPSK